MQGYSRDEGPPEAEETPAKPMPPPDVIVAIGASAGGLDALERLFDGLRPDTGAAFVVIQHLSPDHKSIMATLLGRHTAMPVVTVDDEMVLVPNTVFLIPPATIMTLEGTHLRLVPKARHKLTLPIDEFFRSLAEGYRERVVSVVLSGTGSDGTRGLVAVHERGGLTLAQEPRSARFDGMPRSAIASGVVDFVLDIDSMGGWISERLAAGQPLGEDEPPAPKEAAVARPQQTLDGLGVQARFERIVEILTLSSNINFLDYKPGTVHRRIERRMGVRKSPDLAAYLKLLSEDRTELAALRREMLIPVTSFFRDPEAFEELREKVIDPIVQAVPAGGTIRVWTAGCATGEEAYTLAMLFLDAFERAGRWPFLKVFATDVESANIEHAAAGQFSTAIEDSVPASFRERFFVQRGEHYDVVPELRQAIVFARHNLLTDPPFMRMDMVSCRNTLIYLRPEAQERALRRMHYALRPEGYLFLGASETLVQVQDDFRVLSARHRIWQALRSGSAPAMDRRANPNAVLTGKARERKLGAPVTAVERGVNALSRAYPPPPSVLLNQRHEILHTYGDIGPFLHLREGTASLEVARILVEPLVPVASALLFKAARLGEEVFSEAMVVQARPDGHPMATRLRALPVAPLPNDDDEGPLFLLAFEPSEVVGGDVPVVDIDREVSERVELLESELAMTRENLQAMIEELETSNEELQATNEELMASNEELQSANEELQSVNEELNSVNAEYQEKIDLLNRSNADLDSLTKVMAMGAIFLDADLSLMRFSPDAVDIFQMRDVDIGRPLSDLAHRLDYPDLFEDLRLTLREHRRIEREAAGLNGRHYLVRMLPYRVPSSSRQGVVATFVDITQTRNLLFLQSIIDGLAEHVAVVDEQGSILLVNAAWNRFALENGDEDLCGTGVGKNYLVSCDVGGTVPDREFAQRAADGIRAVLERRVGHFTMEYPCDAPDKPRWFVMHAKPLETPVRGAVVSHVEITRWRKTIAGPEK
ncbi:CheR family methyltransferase [Phaeovulum vinaykumarii]|uniref:Two-component system, chemotaxis family, CheB/CheR fusion protein n=1 Tax=Phaeovulum vinaykumarii TaxID=407234 RepID=A0A1N7M7Y0_9RHOB|nr:CheR family methyltransferase [Phaeovulum vinaykumarii]SIS82190.1 two-component system, chemotaxis family, CheB/CheR fusion protein [Phaeovulum vinaykumarii]SOC11145.1 two-component system CheB/CheR fusion protein [Phaeovulum vinaykumarii]